MRYSLKRRVQSRFESIEGCHCEKLKRKGIPDNGNQKFKAYFADGVCEWHQ